MHVSHHVALPDTASKKNQDTTLLDRTVALEAEKAANGPLSTTESDSKNPATPASANDGTTQIRRDLTEALRANGQLKLRVTAAEKELVMLRAKTKSDTKAIEDLTKERALLAQKVKDRDEELKGKTKFIMVRRIPCAFDGKVLTNYRTRKTRSPY